MIARLDELRRAAELLRRAEQLVDDARAHRDELIRAALDDRQPTRPERLVDVARACGLRSPASLYRVVTDESRPA